MWRKVSEESCSKWIVESDCEEKKGSGTIVHKIKGGQLG